MFMNGTDLTRNFLFTDPWGPRELENYKLDPFPGRLDQVCCSIAFSFVSVC